MKNRFWGNSAYLIISRVLPQGLNLVFLILLAKALSVEHFGSFTVLNSLVVLGNAMTTMGVDIALIRDLRRDTQDRLIPAAFWLQVFSSLIWMFFCFWAVFFYHAGPELLLIHLSLFPMAWMTVCGAVYRAYERMDLMIWRNLAALFLLTCFAPILWWIRADVFSAAVLFVVAQFGAAVFATLLLPLAGVRLNFCWRPVWADIQFMWYGSWRLALFNPLGVLTLRVGIFWVAAATGNMAVGWFSTALRMIEALKTFHFSTTNSLMPAIAREKDGESAPKVQVFVATLLWSVFAVIAITIFGLPVLKFIFGEKYVESYHLLLIMGWALIPHTVTVFSTALLVMRNQESAALRANLAGLLAAFVFYGLLVSRDGLAGAAAAFVLTESFMAAWLGVVVILNRGRAGLYG